MGEPFFVLLNTPKRSNDRLTLVGETGGFPPTVGVGHLQEAVHPGNCKEGVQTRIFKSSPHRLLIGPSKVSREGGSSSILGRTGAAGSSEGGPSRGDRQRVLPRLALFPADSS